MKLIIVRHGETVENATGICQGQSFGTLSEKGKEQAQKVAERLKEQAFDIAYVSDLERTKDTAKEILKHHPDVPVLYTKNLRERSWGIFEGRPRAERRGYSQEKGISLHAMHPEKGESYEQVLERMLHFYNSLLKKHLHHTVLIVGHGGSLTYLLLHLFEKTMDEYKKHHPQNTAVTILEISADKKHTVHVLNCLKHLE